MNRKILSLAIAAALSVLALTGCAKTVAPASGENEQKTDGGNAASVTGSGILAAANSQIVYTTVTGDIVFDAFEEGAQINAGDLIYRIDQTDISNSIEKAKLGLQKAQLAYDQTADNIRKLSVKSGISGTVTKLYVNEGDMVAAGSPVAEVINDSVMVLKVPFIAETADTLYAGAPANVMLVGSFYSLTGTVSKVTSGHIVSADGSVIKMVEIDVSNPGSVAKGDKATATVGSAACSDAGSFDYKGSEKVISEGSGKVASLPLSVGDHTERNGVVAKLTNDTLTSAQDSNALTLQDARLSLESLNNKLKYYNLTAPISGTLISKAAKAGETVTAANMGKLAEVADLSTIQFDMDVDELDVAKIKVGQNVAFTADSLPGKQFAGTVESVSTAGRQVSNVTLYKVTVTVTGSRDGLLPGMNVFASIDVKGE